MCFGDGAGDGNRTHVSGLGSQGNDHYTTPASARHSSENAAYGQVGSTGGICQATRPGIGFVNAAIFYNSLTFAEEVVARLVAEKHSRVSNLKAALFIAVLACLSTRVATSAEPPPCADGQFCDSEGKLQWGGSLRGRLESWRNFAFSPNQHDEFFLGRLLVFADARVSAGNMISSE